MMHEKKIKVVVVAADKKPEVREIPAGLDALQEIVGGYIECIYPFKDNVGFICNEEGKLLNLPLNRALRYEGTREVYDIIAGDFIIAGLGDEDFCSLTEDQIQKYTNMYKKPDEYIRIGKKLFVL